MIPTRRNFLQLGGALLASTFGMRVARAGGSPAKNVPRYLVQIVLQGGMDAIWSTDPKERSQVDSDVDLPYGEKDILSVGDLRLGPHFAPLANWSSQMTILNSVFVGTANHPAGLRQVFRLRNSAVDEMPMVQDIVGARREGQALPNVVLNRLHPSFTANTIGPEVLATIDKTPPDELRLLARIMREQGAGLGRAGSAGATHANVDACADFFDRLTTVPRFVANKNWSGLQGQTDIGASMYRFAEDLQRILWLLENDLSRCALANIGDWDTHAANQFFQGYQARSMFPLVANFLSELQSRKNRHGTLLDNTLVVMSSELGRYPVMNRQKGKDHFPEMPMVFFGAVGGKGKAFGRSGSRMQAFPIAKSSGKPVASGNNVTLTDVGTTLLRCFGVDPETCGYSGETLEFLRAG